jgi:hypothetical protein
LGGGGKVVAAADPFFFFFLITKKSLKLLALIRLGKDGDEAVKLFHEVTCVACVLSTIPEGGSAENFYLFLFFIITFFSSPPPFLLGPSRSRTYRK